MIIHNLLLDSNNKFEIQDVTLGTLITRAGKEHLWNDRNENLIEVLVIHYISAVAVKPELPFDLETILKIFCDYGVSSHFLICRDGFVYRLVPEEKRAWHCGGSIMPIPDMRKNVNDFSIGIELMATAESGFTDLQYTAVSELSLYIENIYKKRFTYVGHDEIAGQRAVDLNLRKDVKVDPGNLFDWNLFEQELSRMRTGIVY